MPATPPVLLSDSMLSTIVIYYHIEIILDGSFFEAFVKIVKHVSSRSACPESCYTSYT